jgi:GntR family transcriptional regulator
MKNLADTLLKRIKFFIVTINILCYTIYITNIIWRKKMILDLDFNSDIPIYTQIREQIIKSIAKGDLKINESLPSVRNMAEEIGVNLHTVNKSYNLLKDEGYINIDRRKGAIVKELPLDKTDDNITKIKSMLDLLVAESYLLGMSREEFLNYSNKLFDEYGVKDYE